VGERYVLDGAHNPAGALQLVKSWRERWGEEKATVVFGALLDKDASAMLLHLRDIAERFYFVPVHSERTISPETFGGDPHLSGMECRTFSSLKDAMEAAASAPRVLIAGSLFLIGEALALLQGKQAPRQSLQ
jgi:dihydrofolate synthase/folylpolyglutamate synthase